MRIVLVIIALLCCSTLGGVAIGHYTISGAAFAAAPGLAMPKVALEADDADTDAPDDTSGPGAIGTARQLAGLASASAAAADQ